MTRMRKTLAALATGALALGVPAALVLGTSAPAQACTFIATRGVAPSCSGGLGVEFTVTATPSVTAPGDPITLTMTSTSDSGSRDITVASTFSISSGSCTGRVCTPDALGTLTIAGQYSAGTGGNASTTVQVVPPDHLMVVPGSDTVTAGGTVAVRVFRAAADGTVLDDDSSRATVTLGGAPCPGAVCTATTQGDQVVMATDGPLTGSAAVRVQAGQPASLVVTPDPHTVWNNDQFVGFSAEAFDAGGNDLGDRTAFSSFSVSPDGSCFSRNYCTAATAGPHTVTATLLEATGSVTLDATAPAPTVVPTLPDGRVGTAYSTSVLSFSDATSWAGVADPSTLPPGLTLARNGVLSGTPTTAGTYGFDVTAGNADGQQTARTTVTIAPGTLPAAPKVSAGSLSVREGNSGRTTIQVPVRLSAASSTPVTVSWHTVNGTAVAGKDYVAAHGTVTIPAGQLTATIPVSVIGDRIKEKNETFTVVLTTPHGATLGTARGIVTVANDD